MIEKILERLEAEADKSYNAYTVGFISDDRAEYDAYTHAIEIVQEVAKDGGWIPVEVAMPENGERVLTTDHLNNYHLFRVLEGVFVDECCQIINENHQRYYPPVAWQRIAPYQKGE